MKTGITFFLFLAFASTATAQVTFTVNGGIGKQFVFKTGLELGYQSKQITSSMGYMIPLSADVKNASIVYAKTAKHFQLNKTHALETGAGFALHKYKREEISKVNSIYSYQKTVYAGKPMFFVTYQNHFKPDRAFLVQLNYTGTELVAGIGLQYFFQKKAKCKTKPVASEPLEVIVVEK